MGLVLRGGGAGARLQPLQDVYLEVAHRTAHLSVARAVAAQARLHQERDAHVEDVGRLLGREKAGKAMFIRGSISCAMADDSPSRPSKLAKTFVL